jgi:histidinol dehydrogenase
VLPTGTTARFASALRVDDFCKHIHVVRLDADALAAVGPAAVTIARAEGLAAHAQSIELRGVRP